MVRGVFLVHALVLVAALACYAVADDDMGVNMPAGATLASILAEPVAEALPVEVWEVEPEHDEDPRRYGVGPAETPGLMPTPTQPPQPPAQEPQATPPPPPEPTYDEEGELESSAAPTHVEAEEPGHKYSLPRSWYKQMRHVRPHIPEAEMLSAHARYDAQCGFHVVCARNESRVLSTPESETAFWRAAERITTLLAAVEDHRRSGAELALLGEYEHVDETLIQRAVGDTSVHVTVLARGSETDRDVLVLVHTSLEQQSARVAAQLYSEDVYAKKELRMLPPHKALHMHLHPRMFSLFTRSALRVRQRLEAMREDVERGTTRLTFAGFSEAGALAQLYAVEVSLQWQLCPHVHPIVLSLGSPRIGGERVAAAVASFTEHLRLAARTDVVAELPFHHDAHFVHGATLSIVLNEYVPYWECGHVCTQPEYVFSGVDNVHHIRHYLTHVRDALHESSPEHGEAVGVHRRPWQGAPLDKFGVGVHEGGASRVRANAAGMCTHAEDRAGDGVSSAEWHAHAMREFAHHFGEEEDEALEHHAPRLVRALRHPDTATAPERTGRRKVVEPVATPTPEEVMRSFVVGVDGDTYAMYTGAEYEDPVAAPAPAPAHVQASVNDTAVVHVRDVVPEPAPVDMDGPPHPIMEGRFATMREWLAFEEERLERRRVARAARAAARAAEAAHAGMPAREATPEHNPYAGMSKRERADARHKAQHEAHVARVAEEERREREWREAEERYMCAYRWGADPDDADARAERERELAAERRAAEDAEAEHLRGIAERAREAAERREEVPGPVDMPEVLIGGVFGEDPLDDPLTSEVERIIVDDAE